MKFERDENGTLVIYTTEEAYSIVLLIEKYAARFDRGTPLQIAHRQITEAAEAGRDDKRELLLEVYEILIARHCMDGNVRIIWTCDHEAA